MAHADVKPEFIVTLAAHEYRLIALGLARMLKNEADIQAALKLNVDLCRIRAAMLKDQLGKAEHSLEGAMELLEDNESDAGP